MNDEEDQGFFLLVLGVLAAIIAVISWWYTTGGIGTAAVPVVAADAIHAADDHGIGNDDDDDEDHDDGADHDADEAGHDGDEDHGGDTQSAAEPEAEPEPDPIEEPEPAPAVPSTVVDILTGNPELSVVTDLIRDEGLDTVLSGDGPFTVFAPSNDAIASSAASDTLRSVLENDRGDVLGYHVVTGDYTAEQLIEIASRDSASGDNGTQLVTVQGETLNLALDGDALVINGAAIVTSPDQLSDNGLVHTLDSVLVPPVAALNSLVTAEPILFDTGSATIRQESILTLERFVEVLSASSVEITIEGHTDSTGDPVLNQNLSQSRARSVLNYLVANGIEERRLDAVGFGPDRPVADNATTEGQALNRRIEFTLNG